MFKAFATRSRKLERLDTGDYTEVEYAKWQSEMKLINRWLGDTRSLRLELTNESRKTDKTQNSILDLGAGSGELLKAAKETFGHLQPFMIGAELNSRAALSIKARSAECGVQALQCDALRLPFADDSFDFVVSSLLLHHLDDDDAVKLFKEMNRVARKKFVVIDLHRHAAAYHLYRTFGSLFLQRFTLDDGALSILRSFRPAELQELAQKAGVVNASVKRRALFRLVVSCTKSNV